MMPNLIGETQSAFVMERQILDGVLIANEVIPWLKRHKKEAVLLKIYFQKAYDTRSGGFLEHIQEMMGFGSIWREWIKQCLTTASISILINGSPTIPFKMERGLRQRDPLSPFLFVLATEAFDILMKVAAESLKGTLSKTCLLGERMSNFLISNLLTTL